MCVVCEFVATQQPHCCCECGQLCSPSLQRDALLLPPSSLSFFPVPCDKIIKRTSPQKAATDGHQGGIWKKANHSTGLHCSPLHSIPSDIHPIDTNHHEDWVSLPIGGRNGVGRRPYGSLPWLQTGGKVHCAWIYFCYLWPRGNCHHHEQQQQQQQSSYRGS